MPPPPDLPPVAGQPLGVLLLASNAAAHVDDTLRRWLTSLDARGDYELLLVDDASSDGTAERARAVGHPRLRVLAHDTPQGEGRALRTGLAALTQPLLAYAPCSPDYRPEHLGLLLDRTIPETQGKEIDHVHLLCGYRAGVPMPLVPRALGFLWRLFCWVAFNYPPARLPGWLGVRRHLGWLPLRFVFALRYHDPMCPLRLFRREILDRLPLQSRGPFAHVELLAKANFLGAVFGSEQVPLDVVPPRYRGDVGQLWGDMRRLMNDPTFGTPESVQGPTVREGLTGPPR